MTHNCILPGKLLFVLELSIVIASPTEKFEPLEVIVIDEILSFSTITVATAPEPEELIISTSV